MRSSTDSTESGQRARRAAPWMLLLVFAAFTTAACSGIGSSRPEPWRRLEPLVTEPVIADLSGRTSPTLSAEERLARVAFAAGREIPLLQWLRMLPDARVRVEGQETLAFSFARLEDRIFDAPPTPTERRVAMQPRYFGSATARAARARIPYRTLGNLAITTYALAAIALAWL